MDDNEFKDLDLKDLPLSDAQIIKNALIDLGDNFWTYHDDGSYSENQNFNGTNITEAVLYLAKEIVELRKQQSQDMRALIRSIHHLQPFNNDN